MRVGKYTAFIIDFVSDFANGKISRYDFEMHYSSYIIEHFPMMEMERENTRLEPEFVRTVDDTIEYAQANSISDNDFKVMVNNALCDQLGVDEPDLI